MQKNRLQTAPRAEKKLLERNTKEESYEQSELLRLYLEASEDYLHPGLSCEAAALKVACEAAKRKHSWAKRQQERRIELEPRH
jgi:hypothetical protein